MLILLAWALTIGPVVREHNRARAHNPPKTVPTAELLGLAIVRRRYRWAFVGWLVVFLLILIAYVGHAADESAALQAVGQCRELTDDRAVQACLSEPHKAFMGSSGSASRSGAVLIIWAVL